MKERGSVADVFAGLARTTFKGKTREDYMAHPKSGKPVLIEKYEATMRRRKERAIEKLIRNPLFSEAVAVYQTREGVPAAAAAAEVIREELVPVVAETVARIQATAEEEKMKSIDLAAFIADRTANLATAPQQYATTGYVVAQPRQTMAQPTNFDPMPGESMEDYRKRLRDEVQKDKSKIPEIREAVIRNVGYIPVAPVAAPPAPDLSMLRGETTADYIARMNTRMQTADTADRMYIRAAINNARQGKVASPPDRVQGLAPAPVPMPAPENNGPDYQRLADETPMQYERRLYRMRSSDGTNEALANAYFAAYEEVNGDTPELKRMRLRQSSTNDYTSSGPYGDRVLKPYPTNKTEAKREIEARIARAVASSEGNKTFQGIENGRFKKTESGLSMEMYRSDLRGDMLAHVKNPQTYEIYSDVFDTIAAKLQMSTADVIKTTEAILSKAVKGNIWPRLFGATPQAKKYRAFKESLKAMEAEYPKIMQVLDEVKSSDFVFAEYIKP
jgi:hypothetical protein